MHNCKALLGRWLGESPFSFHSFMKTREKLPQSDFPNGFRFLSEAIERWLKYRKASELMAKGWSQRQAARSVGVAPSWLSIMRRKVALEGIAAFLPKRFLCGRRATRPVTIWDRRRAQAILLRSEAENATAVPSRGLAEGFNEKGQT